METPIKVLGNGELTKALTFVVDKVSASAEAKIEKAGGKIETPGAGPCDGRKVADPWQATR